VVRDLLDYENGLTSTILVGPSSVEKFTKDGVEGLFVNFDPIASIPSVDSPSSRNPSSRFESGCQHVLGGQFTTNGKTYSVLSLEGSNEPLDHPFHPILLICSL
jgi:hypothetical protein